MLRGGLVRLGYELFRSGESEAVTACGAALELFQSSLLIHDDIMDRDTLRRGAKTLHALYADEAAAAGSRDPDHTGLALGVCAGDIGFFLGFRILADLRADGFPLVEVMSLFAREMSVVGAAQMLDVRSGSVRSATDEKDIITLYRYKTGRYTFSLPLSLGALLAGSTATLRRSLENLGERLGIIFQIKDDELGLFANAELTGKPAGSDLREGKYTVFFARLAPLLTSPEADRFYSVFGKAGLTPSDIEYVRDLVRKTGVAENVGATVRGLADDCRRDIDALAADPGLRSDRLTDLLEYSLTRSF